MSLVIELSKSMEKIVSDWRRLGHKVDYELLAQCAYYPRMGCSTCSWQKPNKSCNRSHILLDTRCNQSDIIINKPPMKKQESKKALWGRVLEEVMAQLPSDQQQLIREAMK